MLSLQILSVNRELLAETIPKLSQNARSELERDMDYVVKGLDKLYSNSPSLTKDQVKNAGDMAEARVGKTVQKVKERVEKQKTAAYDQTKSVVQSQSAAVEKALGHEHADLGKKVGQRRVLLGLCSCRVRWLGWTTSRPRIGTSITSWGRVSENRHKPN